MILKKELSNINNFFNDFFKNINVNTSKTVKDFNFEKNIYIIQVSSLFNNQSLNSIYICDRFSTIIINNLTVSIKDTSDIFINRLLNLNTKIIAIKRLNMISSDLVSGNNKKILNISKKTIEENNLFKLFFIKSKYENRYYDVLDIMYNSKSNKNSCFFADFDIKINHNCFYFNDYNINSAFFNLIFNIILSKYINTKKYRIDLKKTIKFKKIDPKLSIEKCTGSFIVKKYFLNQNGKVFLESKKNKNNIITNLKYLRNVREFNKKKNNIISAPFSYNIP
jgi:hypothetical protein